MADAAAPVETPAPAAEGEAKPERVPLTDEERKAKAKERSEKRKEQRIAARQAIKDAKARGEEVPPKKPKAPKGDKAGPVEAPEGACPKVSVAKLAENTTSADLGALFGKYGTVLRAEVSKRNGKSSNGTVILNTHADVKRAVAALNGKHKMAGQTEPITIQYAKDAAQLGEFLKKATDEVADTLKKFEFQPSILRNKGAKDFLNRVLLLKKKAPTPELLTAGLLVSQNKATAEDLVKKGVVEAAAPVQNLVREDKAAAERAAAAAEAAAAAAPKGGKAERGERREPAIRIEKTFDAVIPQLDKLEKERWNRMAKANLRLSERYRFRFVDILATPSLELWRWMVEDCDITPAEAGTCFAILQNNYGYRK